MVGAALGLSACGGVLGAAVSETITSLAPVACAIDNANAEEQNYGSALFLLSNGLPFEGAPEDDLTKDASRRRAFGERLAELRRAGAALDRLAPADATERELVTAASEDLRAATALMRFDQRWAPGDHKAPESPVEVPTTLRDVIDRSSDDVKGVFADCPVPASLARRGTAYAG